MIEVLFIKAKVRLGELFNYGLYPGCIIEYDSFWVDKDFDPEDRKEVFPLAQQLVIEELGHEDHLLTSQLVDRIYEYLNENFDVIPFMDFEKISSTIYCVKELNIKNQKDFEKHFMF